MKAIKEAGNVRTYDYFELQNRYSDNKSGNWYRCKTIEAASNEEARTKAKAEIKEKTKFDENLRIFIDLGGKQEYRLVKVRKICETI